MEASNNGEGNDGEGGLKNIDDKEARLNFRVGIMGKR